MRKIQSIVLKHKKNYNLKKMKLKNTFNILQKHKNIKMINYIMKVNIANSRELWKQLTI